MQREREGRGRKTGRKPKTLPVGYRLEKMTFRA